MHFKHVHVFTSSPCLPLLLEPKFFLTLKWESDFDLRLCKEVPFVPCHFYDFSLSKIHYVCDVISWKFFAFISLVTSHGTFVQFPPPLKKRWYPHHNLHFLCFFTGLLWNSFMASWACSTYDSFTQDASIGWYLFHLTKHSRFCLFNCHDLSITSILNLGSLSMKLGGSFVLYFLLSLEASQVTNLKKKTWNMGWTLRFFYNSNLKVLGNFFLNTLNGLTYGPKNSWFKPSSNQFFLMFNHTSSLCSKFTLFRNLFTKSFYYFYAF